jgi:arylsulfatase
VVAANEARLSRVFDLIADPKEEYPATGLRSTWNAAPAMKIVAEFEESLKKYPPIAPGTPDPYRPLPSAGSRPIQ